MACETREFPLFPDAMERRVNRSGKQLLGIAFAALFLFAANAQSQIHTALLPARSEEWQSALETRLKARLQLKFNTNLFLQDTEFFSSLVIELPDLLPECHLTALARGLSTVLIRVDEMDLGLVKRLGNYFRGLRPEELRKYRLLEKVRVFDPQNAEIVITGSETRKRIGFRVDAQYSQWRQRFFQLMAEKDPALYQELNGTRQRVDDAENTAVIEIFRWIDRNGKALPLEGLPQAIEALRAEVSRQLKKVPNIQPVEFAWDKIPLELASLNDRGNSESTPLMSIRPDSSGKIQLGDTSRWYAKQIKVGNLVEFRTERFLNGDSLPIQLDDGAATTRWLGPALFPGEHLGMDDFRNFESRLSPQLLPIYQALGIVRDLRRKATRVEGVDAELYTLGETHPTHLPQRAAQISKLIDRISLPPSAELFHGYGVYGSTTRREFLYPADSDLLMNTLVRVPDHIQDFESANRYAAQSFVRNVLGHFARLAQRGTVSISELRMGSDKTMGIDLGHRSPIDEFWSNPYLTQENVIDGHYTDKNGKTWTLLELFQLGDFIKTKFDYFWHEDGQLRRSEVSLQFLPGFEWKGKIYFQRRTGLKGSPSTLLSTGVYYGADAFGIGSILAKAVSNYVGQRGPLVAGTIREILQRAWDKSADGNAYMESPALWSTKLIKAVYNYLVFGARNGYGVDEIFYTETSNYLKQHGLWDPNLNLGMITDSLLSAINTPEVALMSALKRLVNDFAEFNEREQVLEVNQWLTRRDELLSESPQHLGVLPRFYAAVKEGRIRASDSFLNLLRAFHQHLLIATAKASAKDAVNYLAEKGRPKNFGKLAAELEHEIIQLEHAHHNDPRQAKAIPPHVRRFLESFLALAPHLHSRYIRSRFQISETELRLHYRLLGVQLSESNVELMKSIDENFEKIEPRTLAQHQRRLFRTPKLKKRLGCESGLEAKNIP